MLATSEGRGTGRRASGLSAVPPPKHLYAMRGVDQPPPWVGLHRGLESIVRTACWYAAGETTAGLWTSMIIQRAFRMNGKTYTYLRAET
jgi:hypothetical protein